MIPIKTVFGEEKAWGVLRSMPPEDVARRAAVSYDPSKGLYIINSFGIEITASPKDRLITSDDPQSDIFLNKLKDFFRLSLLWYLVGAKDIPETGRLIRPIDVKGGQRFFSGTHVLPLDQVVERYGSDKIGFLEKGRALGAEQTKYGDAGLKLFPVPRIPVHLILWIEDEEFPARADLLFDSTCDFHVPTSDIIWAIAMMSVLAVVFE